MVVVNNSVLSSSNREVLLEDDVYKINSKKERIPKWLKTLPFFNNVMLKLNPNTKYVLLHELFYTLYASATILNLFDAYLYILVKERGLLNFNTWVGFAESISGFTSIVFAIPLGIIVDKADRIFLAHFTGWLGIITCAIQFYAYLMDNLYLILLNMFLSGLINGLQGTAINTIFVDSLDPDTRLTQYTTLSVIVCVALIFGPVINLCMFTFLSNTWTLGEVRIPLLAGTILGPISFYFLFFFEKQIDSSNSIAKSASSVSTIETIAGQAFQDSSVEEEEDCYVSLPQLEISDDNEEINESHAESTQKLKASRFDKFVPYFLILVEFIIAIGAGMTVRFFSLFFINDYGMSPRTFCYLLIVLYILLALTYSWAPKAVELLGRPQTSLLCFTGGVLTLYSMSYVRNYPALIVLYILRAILSNAPAAIDQAILFEYVPEESRGKWSALLTVSHGVWAFSALFGGMLADHNDYRYTFHVTATIYSIGTLCYLPLLFIVPKHSAVKQT